MIEFAVVVGLSRIKSTQVGVLEIKVDANERKQKRKESKEFQSLNKSWGFVLPSVNGLDFAAFWAYLLFYALFNLVYWVGYKN